MGNAISDVDDPTVFQEPRSETFVTDDYATTDNEERTWHEAKVESASRTKTSLSTPKNEIDRYSPVRRRRPLVEEEDVTTQPSSSEGESSTTWHPQLKIDTVSDADELTAMTDMAHDGALVQEYSMEQPSLQPGSSIDRYRSRSILTDHSRKRRGLSPHQLPKHSLIEPSSESQGNEEVINAEEEYSKVMTDKDEEEEEEEEEGNPHYGEIEDDMEDDADDEDEQEDSSSDADEEGELSEDDGDNEDEPDEEGEGDDGYNEEEEVASVCVRSAPGERDFIHIDHFEKSHIDRDAMSYQKDTPRGRSYKIGPRSIKSASTKHHGNHAKQNASQDLAQHECNSNSCAAGPKMAASNLSQSEESNDRVFELSRNSGGTKDDPISLVEEQAVQKMKSVESTNRSPPIIDDANYDATSDGAVRGASLSPLQLNAHDGFDRDSTFAYNPLSPGTTNALMDDMSQTSELPPQALRDLVEASVSEDFVVKVGEKMKVISLGSDEEETVPETATLVTQTLDGSHDHAQDAATEVSNGGATTSQDNVDIESESTSCDSEEKDILPKYHSNDDIPGSTSRRSCDPDGLKSFDSDALEVNKRKKISRRSFEIARSSAASVASAPFVSPARNTYSDYETRSMSGLSRHVANHANSDRGQTLRDIKAFHTKQSATVTKPLTEQASPRNAEVDSQNLDPEDRHNSEYPMVAQALSSQADNQTNNPNSPSNVKQLTSADFEDIDMNFVEQYDSAFTEFIAQYPHLVKRNPEMIDNLRVAKLQLLLEATSYVEDELIDYVKVLHEKKKEMADFYQGQLLDAAKKKAAREIHLQHEYNALERSTRIMEGKLTWQFITMCQARAKKQAQMLQHFAEMKPNADNPLSMLPDSLHTQSIRDAVTTPAAVGEFSEDRVKELQQFQVDHAFLKAEVTVLEKKLAYQVAVAKRYSWVDSVLKRLDKKQLKRLRTRYESKLGVSLK